jgi:hypothetical protein
MASKVGARTYQVTQGEALYLTPTVGQQIFVIGSGVAGGVGGFLLAKELSGVDKIPSTAVIVATIISFFGTLGAAVYLARKARGY